MAALKLRTFGAARLALAARGGAELRVPRCPFGGFHKLGAPLPAGVL